MMERERDIQARVLLAAGGLPGVRLFRNTVGEGWHGRVLRHEGDILVLQNPRRVAFGLLPGSPDLVGWQAVTVGPEMIGRRLARFAGLEVKTATGAASDGQRRFLGVLDAAGGLAATVRDPAEAVALFGGGA